MCCLPFQTIITCSGGSGGRRFNPPPRFFLLASLKIPTDLPFRPHPYQEFLDPRLSYVAVNAWEMKKTWWLSDLYSIDYLHTFCIVIIVCHRRHLSQTEADWHSGGGWVGGWGVLRAKRAEPICSQLHHQERHVRCHRPATWWERGETF